MPGKEAAARTPNRLAREKSPYLLKHAHNPVNWYTWGKEAFNNAKASDKPIFLSIGYFSCHWCSVMERESFEDEGTAELMNRNFISIKVDREERPEVDSYYMEAVQSMTGGGGWPLSVFLTPDLKPFYGGTYYPPEPRYGMPSFRQVLEFVAKVWAERKGDAVSSSDQIASALSAKRESGKASLTKGLLESGYEVLAASFDAEHGGFGGAPKFPLPVSIMYLLRYHARNTSSLALKMATRTLDGIMRGGIRDHVGGGFHRYSTDKVWLIPHFEKMLYDNALLAEVYTEAHLTSGDHGYADVARETLDWMLSDLKTGGGGFCSALDADTEEGEGAYYSWTVEEVARVLGKDSDEFCKDYGVTKSGNFEGRTVLHLSGDATDVRRRSVWVRKLAADRRKRPTPGKDNKVPTSWNGLAISALSKFGAACGRPEYIKHAENCARFLLEHNAKEGALLRRSVEGEGAFEGTLEDYAFLVRGLLDLFEADSQPRWLAEAKRLNGIMVSKFADEEGGFFLTDQAGQFRRKEEYDGPTPSGASVAAVNLLRLYELTGEDSHRKVAQMTVESLGRRLEDQPASHMMMMIAADLLVNGMTSIVISARTGKETEAMQKVVRSRFSPGVTVVVATSETFDELAGLTLLLEGKEPKRAPIAYVCEGFVCKTPARTPEEVQTQLSRAVS